MQEVWTIGRILKWTESFFQEKGIESPRLDAEVLLSAVLKKDRIHLYVHFDQPLIPEELAAFRAMVKARASHTPVAYILGKKEFMGLTFRVTEATLVPRPDTEILVQAAVDELRKAESPGKVHFADIGTGSGAICLTALHFLPEATADTVDISEAARAVAEENAERLGVAGRCTFHTGDLLEPLSGKTYDAILSNPPYIPEADIEHLSPDVRLKEPKTALSGGKDGLDFYRRLAKDAPAMLKEKGFLAVEVGIHQAKPVAELFAANPLIGRTETKKDLAGIDRVVIGWK